MRASHKMLYLLLVQLFVMTVLVLVSIGAMLNAIHGRAQYNIRGQVPVAAVDDQSNGPYVEGKHDDWIASADNTHVNGTENVSHHHTYG